MNSVSSVVFLLLCILTETAKANGLELYQYLRYILTELPYLERSPAHKDLETLMSW